MSNRITKTVSIIYCALLVIFIAVVHGKAANCNNFYKKYRLIGSLRTEEEYENNILTATKVFDEQGALCKEIIHGWAGKIGVNRSYFKGGKLKEEYYFQKGCLLAHRKFGENGRLMLDVICQCGSYRKDREFYANGHLKNEITYIGLRFASIIEYDEKGNLLKQFVRKNVPFD